MSLDYFTEVALKSKDIEQIKARLMEPISNDLAATHKKHLAGEHIPMRISQSMLVECIKFAGQRGDVALVRLLLPLHTWACDALDALYRWPMATFRILVEEPNAFARYSAFDVQRYFDDDFPHMEKVTLLVRSPKYAGLLDRLVARRRESWMPNNPYVERAYERNVKFLEEERALAAAGGMAAPLPSAAASASGSSAAIPALVSSC